MPGGNTTVMAQDGLQGEDGAAIEPLARFGSLHDVPTFSLSVGCWWKGSGEGMEIHGHGDNSHCRIVRLESNAPEFSCCHGLVHFLIFFQHLGAIPGRDRNGLRRNPSRENRPKTSPESSAPPLGWDIPAAAKASLAGAPNPASVSGESDLPG